jgi:hypothetical protein
MSTLKIKTQVTHKEEREVEIPIPSFWKEVTILPTIIGILDEHTMYEVWTCDDSSTLKSMDLKSIPAEIRLNKLSGDFVPATEEEFMSAYKDARFKTDLEPMLISKEVI